MVGTPLMTGTELKHSETREGMMGWAGTGPAGKSCFDCAAFGERGGKWRNDELSRRCMKFVRYMRGINNGQAENLPLRPSTKACSYFELWASS